jgi:hypothetical protein
MTAIAMVRSAVVSLLCLNNCSEFVCLFTPRFLLRSCQMTDKLLSAFFYIKILDLAIASQGHMEYMIHGALAIYLSLTDDKKRKEKKTFHKSNTLST